MYSRVLLAVTASLAAALPQYDTGSSSAGGAGRFLGLGDGLNFNFTPSDTPLPFKVDVDPDFIAMTRLKASLYRPSRDIAQPDWTDGPPAHNLSNVQQYWVQNYSWFDVQSDINNKYTQFTTTVSGGPNFTEPVHVHFAHQKSNRSDAIPLLLLHGWASSFLEWDAVIGSLASPLNASLPSFHAVAPDLPGFGFSPAVTVPGFGSREAGIVMNNVMKQLGYDKYAIYTTDLGAFTGNWMVSDFADSITSRLTDFFFVTPNATDLQRHAANETTVEENTFLDRINTFATMDEGYIGIQTTKPLALVEGLNDSPIGFLAWMWNLHHSVSGAYEYAAQELITDAMVLYIPGLFGNIRAYKEWWAEGALNQTAYPSSKVPTGVTHWPSGPLKINDPFSYAVSTVQAYIHSVAKLTCLMQPVSWIQRTANLTFFRKHDYGGHFPAVVNPQQWLDDAWAFFGDPSVSQ